MTHTPMTLTLDGRTVPLFPKFPLTLAQRDRMVAGIRDPKVREHLTQALARGARGSLIKRA